LTRENIELTYFLMERLSNVRAAKGVGEKKIRSTPCA
jgi:hypothetical protein